MNPIIVIDSREQTPLNFTRFQYERGSLQSGDYSIKGLEQMMTIERKSACDLIQSVTRERARLERELHRLRASTLPACSLSELKEKSSNTATAPKLRPNRSCTAYTPLKFAIAFPLFGLAPRPTLHTSLNAGHIGTAARYRSKRKP
jgi:hypothetical protein